MKPGLRDQFELGMFIRPATTNRAQWISLQAHPRAAELKENWSEMADAMLDIWCAVVHGEAPIEETNAFVKLHNLMCELNLRPDSGDRRKEPRVSLLKKQVGEIMRDFDLNIERLRRWVEDKDGDLR